MACPYERPCHEVYPNSPADWCPSCRDAWESWPDDDRPAPLDAHQVEALDDWLALGDRPAWSLEQVTRPSPN